VRSPPFSQPTLLAAIELLELHSQARFNQTVLRLGFENDVPQGTDLNVGKKCAILDRLVLQRSHAVLDTLDGSMTLGEAVVRKGECTSQSRLLRRYALTLAFNDGF
jgi:hypothetical protein